MQFLIIGNLRQRRQQKLGALDAERQMHPDERDDLLAGNRLRRTDQQRCIKQKHPARPLGILKPEKPAEIVAAAVSPLVREHLPSTPCLFQHRRFLRRKCCDLLYHTVTRLLP